MRACLNDNVKRVDFINFIFEKVEECVGKGGCICENYVESFPECLS